jgi:hypothetical protein
MQTFRPSGYRNGLKAYHSKKFESYDHRLRLFITSNTELSPYWIDRLWVDQHVHDVIVEHPELFTTKTKERFMYLWDKTNYHLDQYGELELRNLDPDELQVVRTGPKKFKFVRKSKKR